MRLNHPHLPYAGERRRLWRAVLVAAALMLCSGVSAASETATIIVSDLNVRSGPGTGERVLFRLPRQTRVRVLDHQQGWLRIDHNGRRGFILNSPKYVTIEKIDEQPHPSPDDASVQMQRLQADSENLQQKIASSKARLAETTRKEKTLLDEIDRLDKALDIARRRVREARAALKALQEKLDFLEQQRRALENDIRTSEAYAARRLAALYKLSWLGRVQLLATAESFYDFIQRKSALERVLSRDEQMLEKLHRDRAALVSLLDQLHAGRAKKHDAQAALNRRLDALQADQAERARMLDSIRSRKELQIAAVQALRQAARKLDGIIETLEPPRPAAPASGNGEQKEYFEASKGLLGWPVKGKIISFFGPYRDEKTNVVNFQSGINIEAERGEPVRAVSDGHAIYTDWFKGFGNMMIIDHGNHYYTVYAHLEEVFKARGDRVEKGEVIATVGDSGSLVGPALHFEVRHHGKPVDPLNWIKKG